MKQLSTRVRHFIIVCLVVLVPGAAIAIQNAPSAEPIKTCFKKYVEPVLGAAEAIVTAKVIKDIFVKIWSHPRFGR